MTRERVALIRRPSQDTVVVCGDVAVLTRPGAAERRAEVEATEDAVRALGLEVARIEEPRTLDGGDVLQVGATLTSGGADGPTPRAFGSRWTAA